MVSSPVSPFAEEALEEVRLDPAPLVRVLAQLRFPPVLGLARDDFIVPFQEHLRGRYPLLTPETRLEAILGPQGVVQQETAKVWRFQDIEEQWTVILGTGSVSLETSVYESRDDFVDRLEEVLVALDAVEPKPVMFYERLGVRYINALRGEDLTRLNDYVCPEMYGPLAMTMPDGMDFIASVGQAHFRLDGPQMQARWAKLPPNVTFLPDIPPTDEPTWLLDIDAYFDARSAFTPASAAAAARHAATHAYRFFRWAMLSEFIEERSTR